MITIELFSAGKLTIRNVGQCIIVVRKCLLVELVLNLEQVFVRKVNIFRHSLTL